MVTQPTTIFLTKHQKREMAYNGPMRSGLVIDSRTLLAKGYEKYQNELLEVLNPAGSGEWYGPHMQHRDNKMQIDVDTRRGRTIIPGYFIGRQLAGEALTSLLKQNQLPLSVADGEDRAVFHITSLDIRLYDMGYGSATFKGEIEGLKDLDVDAFREAAEKISSHFSQFRDLFTSTFAHVAATVKKEFIALSYHGNAPVSAYWRASNLGQGIGDLFWVHRLFTISCDNHQQFTRKKDLCKSLVYSEHASMLEDASINPHMTVYPGNGNSAVIYEKDKVRHQDVTVLSSMVRAQNIFYVTAEDVDRDMFYLANELDRTKHSKDMKLLEGQSDIIVDYQSKVTFFKGVYDDYDNSLDPQGLKVWHALEKAWSTRDRFENMNAKLELVEKIYNRIRENLNHLQNKRMGIFMLAFTIINTLQAITDAVEFTQGGGLQSPSTVRMVVLIVMTLFVTVFGLMLLWDRDKKA